MQWRVLLGKTKLVENIIKTQSLSHKLVLNEVGRFFIIERTLLKPLMWDLQWKLHSVHCIDAARILDLWNATKSKSHCLSIFIHSMGMSHDDDHTTCTGHSHIMSGEWVKGRNPSDLSWSSCSRDDLENFLRWSLPSFFKICLFLFKICLFSWCSTVTQKKYYLDLTWPRTLCCACPKGLFQDFKLCCFVFSHTVIPLRHYFTTWDNEP